VCSIIVAYHVIISRKMHLLHYITSVLETIRKPPLVDFYRSSIETIGVNCLVFEKIALFAFWRQDPRWRFSAILYFRGPITGSLKNPCATSYRSSIETIAINCLVFEKIAFLQFGYRQTDRPTNRWTRPSHEAALAVASGGLITLRTYLHCGYTVTWEMESI